MTGQVQHLRSIVARLEERSSALGDPIRPALAAEVMDLWLRCRAFSVEQLEEAGVTGLMASVEARILSERESLAEAAGRGVDLEDLWQRGLGLLEHEDEGAAKAWGLDVLRVANLASEIPDRRGERARKTVQRCLDLAGSEPRHFLGASSVVLDRWELEPVDELDPFAVEAHRVFETLPLEALIDASAPPLPQEQLRSLLDPIRNGTVWKPGITSLPADDEPWIDFIRPREEQVVSTAEPAGAPGFWTRVLERADDAIQDALGWKRALAALIAGSRTTGETFVFADDDPGEMVRLGHYVDHDWWLLRDARGLSLYGPVLPDVSVTAILGEEHRDLERTARDKASKWLLPTADLWPAGLRLDVRVGPDSFVLDLPGEIPED